MQQCDARPRVRRLQFTDDQIDCPQCGPGTTARLVIREATSGIAVVSCLSCRRLYPAEMAGGRSWRCDEAHRCIDPARLAD
jgi:hypothetical protein